MQLVPSLNGQGISRQPPCFHGPLCSPSSARVSSASSNLSLVGQLNFGVTLPFGSRFQRSFPWQAAFACHLQGRPGHFPGIRWTWPNAPVNTLVTAHLQKWHVMIDLSCFSIKTHMAKCWDTKSMIYCKFETQWLQWHWPFRYNSSINVCCKLRTLRTRRYFIKVL